MYDCQDRFKGLPLAEGVEEVFTRLLNYFGPQHWWPGDTPLEIIVGAILTQGVNWSNVEKAIKNLKQEDLLEVKGLYQVNESKLARLIRPTGYYNMKAKKIKALINFLCEKYDGQLDKMFTQPLSKLRSQLLDVYGIGPETADSILLYAGGYPVFVIDAYTKRIFSRLGYVSPDIKYHDLQQRITSSFPEDVDKYNEYHALLVALGNNKCKKTNPECGYCPLNKD